MDRSYKEDVPALRRALEALRREFARLDSRTDWKRLRIEPLLAHARGLERLMKSPKFARETSRLPGGVAMFHSDLVYLRNNVKTLRAILRKATRA